MLSTVSDRLNPIADATGSLVAYYQPDITSATDYYPFGMQMPGRVSSAASYRYGFNGQERSTEINDNSMTAEFWQYDARLGRRWNMDPKSTIGISDYVAFFNNPIFLADPFGDKIDSNRTKGLNFFVVPNKTQRDKDVYTHGKLGSAYYQDYKKAKKMESRSHGQLIVIEAANADDAVCQITEKCGADGYVKNMIIDFHAGRFGRYSNYDKLDKSGNRLEIYDDWYSSSYNILGSLKAGYAGVGTSVYLGQCWAGGNSGMQQDNLTLQTSIALDGATVYGHQAANSSISFVLFRTFVGPIFEDYASDPENIGRKKYHSVSFFSPSLKNISSVEVFDRIKIGVNGEIHNHLKKPLDGYPKFTPYQNNIVPILNSPLEEVGPPAQ